MEQKDYKSVQGLTKEQEKTNAEICCSMDY